MRFEFDAKAVGIEAVGAQCQELLTELWELAGTFEEQVQKTLGKYSKSSVSKTIEGEGTLDGPEAQ